MFMSNPVILWVCEDWGQRFSLVSHCIPMPSYVCSSSVDICWMYGSLVISERTEAIAWKVKVNVAQLCLTLCDPMDCSLRNSPGENTGVGSLSLLQGIFPTQGSNPCLPHCGWILYQLSQNHTQMLQHACQMQLKGRLGICCFNPDGIFSPVFYLLNIMCL